MFIIVYAMQIVWELGSFIAWFVIVVAGRQPKGLQDMIVLGLSYQQRAYCYLALLSEEVAAVHRGASGGFADRPRGRRRAAGRVVRGARGAGWREPRGAVVRRPGSPAATRWAG